MDIHCPRCGAEPRAADINLDRMVAKCYNCNAVYSIADQVPHNSLATAPRMDVPLPENMTLEQEPGGLVIRRRWFGWQYIFLLVFAIFWDGFLLIFIGIAFSFRVGAFALFPSIHVLVGIFITYTAIAGLVNMTTIHVGYEGVRVRHGPLPWRGNTQLATTDLRQVFCRERVTRGRGSTSVYYDVYAIRADGSDTKVVSSLPNAEQALFLEQEIERYLGIKDQPVRGEVAR
jgi:hypothetical protein